MITAVCFLFGTDYTVSLHSIAFAYNFMEICFVRKGIGPTYESTIKVFVEEWVTYCYLSY